jgi:xylulose-5-phosphate/fructose-6-phosphate phosphoketolase
MTVRNGMDRYHLMMDVFRRVPKLSAAAAQATETLRDKLIEHNRYIAVHGDDMPEIRDWSWPHH